MRTNRRFEDDDAFDENGILRDGAVARVRMTMRDSVDDDPLSPGELARRMQMADAERRRRGPVVTDAAGDSLFGLRKPGFRYLQGGSAQDQRRHQALRDAAAQAYRDAREHNENAWRVPLPSASPTTGAHKFSGPQEGQPCTRDGYSGTWEIEDDGELYCAIDRRQSGSTDGKTLAQLKRDHASVMEAAYAAYAKELSESWKSR
jgi:hypothetical protein